MNTAPTASTTPVQLNSVTIEHGEGGLVTLQVEVAPETVQTTREQVMRDYARRLKIPGFRPGRIPANIVRRNVGDEAIAQRVSDQLVPAAYQQALEQEDLQPLSRAEVDQLTFDAFTGEQPLQFKAQVVVRPPIELGEPTGLSATRPRVEVSEEDVDNALEGLRAEHATPRNVEGRGAQEGDLINAELQVFLDGQPRTPEPTRLRPFILGESGFVPSIDEHLIGVELDEERRFNVTYPSTYNDPELAGQVAEFAVKVTAVKERVLPDVNDEFAQRLGLEDEAALRERMRQIIREDQERASQNAVRTQLVQAATDAAQFELPTHLAARRAHSRLHSLEHEVEQRGMTMEQYLENAGQTREELEAETNREMEEELRRELVLDEIVRRENLSVSPEEVEQHYQMLCAYLQQPIEKVLEQFDVNSVQASLLQRKAVDWLVENAVITDEETTENGS